ncbi:hypothetical protein [Simkania sp.]|uniref:hypothetical protein n=1 Tax=Simkania sp. TaxID=34094 RepID=UPI003B51C646
MNLLIITQPIFNIVVILNYFLLITFNIIFCYNFLKKKEIREIKMSTGFTHLGAGIPSQPMPNQYEHGGCTYYGAPPPQMQYQQPYYPPAYSFSDEQANANLKFYADADDLVMAEQTLALFDQHGFKPSSVNYTKMINAYGRSGQLDAAFNIFQKMQEKGIKPTTFHYHALMHQCVKNGQEGRVFGLFHDMRKKQVKPNKLINIQLISANVNLGNMARAGQIFRKYIGSPKVFQQSGKPHIDCHDLSPQAAFVQVTEFLNSHDGKPFSVIVGQGWHSKGQFQMKDYMLNKLKDYQDLEVTERKDNPGILDVSYRSVQPQQGASDSGIASPQATSSPQISEESDPKEIEQSSSPKNELISEQPEEVSSGPEKPSFATKEFESLESPKLSDSEQESELSEKSEEKKEIPDALIGLDEKLSNSERLNELSEQLSVMRETPEILNESDQKLSNSTSDDEVSLQDTIQEIIWSSMVVVGGLSLLQLY